MDVSDWPKICHNPMEHLIGQMGSLPKFDCLQNMGILNNDFSECKLKNAKIIDEFLNYNMLKYIPS